VRRVLFWLAIGIGGTAVPATADTLRLSNCTDRAPGIVAYDQDNATCWNWQSSATLPGCGSVTFTCNGACKIHEGAIPRGTLSCDGAETVSGAHTYVKQGVTGTITTDTPGLRTADEGTWSLLCTCDQAEMQW
jgi:hypothetical protein